MTQRLSIHFWAQGDDPVIPTLHELWGCSLERGWVKPFVKGEPLLSGTPSPTHSTSITIVEDLEDEQDNPKANARMLAWLNACHKQLVPLKCATKGIRVSIYLHPTQRYEAFAFSPQTAEAAVFAGCGLAVLVHRLEPETDAP
jgi:hypothetical protein